MDGYIFKELDNSEYGILVPNLWQEHFRMFELNEIMRQRDSKMFAEMLNRLREGKHSCEDIMKLKERLIDNNNNNNNNNNGLFTVFQQKRGSYNCKCYLHYHK